MFYNIQCKVFSFYLYGNLKLKIMEEYSDWHNRHFGEVDYNTDECPECTSQNVTEDDYETNEIDEDGNVIVDYTRMYCSCCRCKWVL